MVGGSVGFSSQKQKFEFGSTSADVGTNTNISLTPSFGIFVADGIVAGAGLSITSNKFKSDVSDITNTLSSFSFAPFGRYYHESGLFGHLNFEIGSANDKDKSGGITTETKFSVFGWRAGGGYALFLNNNVAVEPMVTYGSRSLKLKDSDPEQKDIFSGLMINVGFNIFIN